MNEFIIVPKEVWIATLDDRINKLSEKLLNKINQNGLVETDKIGVKEASELTGLSINTIYQYSSRNQIPKLKSKSRKLCFSKKELIAWINLRKSDVLGDTINELIKKQNLNQLGGRNEDFA